MNRRRTKKKGIYRKKERTEKGRKRMIKGTQQRK
jgi:hypothetical protein